MGGWADLIARCIAICIIVTWPMLLIYYFRDKIKQVNRNKKSNIIEKDYQLNNDHQYDGNEAYICKDYKESYEPQYLMTMNERTQFKKIQEWASNNNYLVFAKVRLLDLVKPRSNQKNFKSLLWKIQAKHVDFVICDKSMNVKCIIEINDNSHNKIERISRDKFVREVLEGCNYKVIQTYYITEEQLNSI